jgi:hypothetical protein
VEGGVQDSAVGALVGQLLVADRLAGDGASGRRGVDDHRRVEGGLQHWVVEVVVWERGQCLVSKGEGHGKRIQYCRSK